ncbi:unnamed protein product [Effrenium voratum]|nr:unnamed protein product [Effrenium voratum]
MDLFKECEVGYRGYRAVGCDLEPAFRSFQRGGPSQLWVNENARSAMRVDFATMTLLAEGAATPRRLCRGSVPEAAATRPWLFETGSGFKPFFPECQDQLETCHQQFQAGGPSQVWIVSGGKRIRIDFQRMTQVMEGSSRIRAISRG